MKTHLNTLFVTSDGTYLGKEGEAVSVKQGEERTLRVPIHMIESIVCLARATVSPHLMALCAARGVSITFLEPTGRFHARVEGRGGGNVLLRKDQFRASEDTLRTLEFSRAFVQAKIHNSRILITRAIRDHGDTSAGELESVAGVLSGCLRRATAAKEINELRGVEGEAARHYFSVFSHLIRSDDDLLRMDGRNRRPPRDPINAMLSFGYALLASDTRSACETVGLDPQVGFLHADRPGRVGLALDLAEDLRSVLADRVVLSLLNRQQITSDQFETDAGGAVRMG
ncbi:MAG: CRISPR-associated endonuclease Cas1, partial [Acidobacteriota bacterium]